MEDTMLTRRSTLLSLAALPLAGPGLAATLGDDGLYDSPVISDTFLELGPDLEDAAANGKGLIVLFEQRGCPYCRELHEVNFAKPEIAEFQINNFTTLQLDMWGSRAVVDFDGAEIEERELATRWAVNFTPTLVFFTAESGPREVFRMPGHFKPFHYIAALEYVAFGHHKDQPFQRYLQDKLADYAARGVDPAVWE